MTTAHDKHLLKRILGEIDILAIYTSYLPVAGIKGRGDPARLQEVEQRKRSCRGRPSCNAINELIFMAKLRRLSTKVVHL